MKQTAVMPTKELSTLTVDQILDAKNLPDDFEKLSARKQKEIIVGAVLQVYKKALDCMTFEQKAKEAARKLSAEVKASPAQMKLTALRKDMKRNENAIRTLLERYYGMRELASALGINEKTFSQMKQIEEA